jgi:hypothetical protein
MTVLSASIPVASTATMLDPSTDPSRRQQILVRNRGDAAIAIGGPAVTFAAGTPLNPGEDFAADLGQGEALYGITSSGTTPVFVLQVDGPQ